MADSDSDATVMEDDSQDDQMVVESVSESPVLTSSPSPSILRPGLQQALITRSTGTSFSEQQECEDSSQELPLQAPIAQQQNVQSVISTSTVHDQPCSSQSDQSMAQVEQLHPNRVLLDKIVEQQLHLMNNLGQMRGAIATEQIVRLRDKQLELENKLKSISSDNQSERKRLLEACTRLKQTPGGVPDSLKQQLINLGKKQKQLVECFSRQVEISGLLDKILPPKEKVSKSTQNCQQSSSQALTQPALPSTSATRHTIQSQPLSQRSITHYSRPEVGSKPASKPVGEPVPLSTLITHGFLKPGKNNLSCQILGCLFKASLLKDGGIQDSNTSVCYMLPGQWLKSCWAKLGHPQKKIVRKLAYSSVMYSSMPLIHYCDSYSVKQVSSYLSNNPPVAVQPTASCESQPQQRATNEVGSQAPLAANTPMETELSQETSSMATKDPVFNLSELLANGRVWLVQEVKPGCSTSLPLPEGFWTNPDTPLPAELLEIIKQDLECW